MSLRAGGKCGTVFANCPTPHQTLVKIFAAPLKFRYATFEDSNSRQTTNAAFLSIRVFLSGFISKVTQGEYVCMMGSTSLVDLITALPDGDGWGPQTTTETTLNGVPYAPFSKGDKLGRMADWTADGKDGRDGRGGRQQYNRNYRGK